MSAALEIARGTTGRPADAALDLYKRHGERVYSFCVSRLRNAEEAQDAAQTTFVYVLTALKRGVVPRNELAWLLTIADNVCRSSRRSLGRRLAHLSSADVDEVEAAATSMSAETSEQIEGLRAALEQLPETQRRAILLREWQGLSYVDIADQLGLSVAAVETLLFRARRGLTARVARPGSLRALDLGSALALVRSLFDGTTAKLAVGAAGLALVAAAPALEREIPATDSKPSVVRASLATRLARTMPKPAGRKRVSRSRARTAPIASTRPRQRAAVASHPRATPVLSAAPTSSPVAKPQAANASPQAAAAAAPAVPVAQPTPAPPAPVTSAVSGVTQVTTTVVTAATQALPPVLPGP